MAHGQQPQRGAAQRTAQEATEHATRLCPSAGCDVLILKLANCCFHPSDLWSTWVIGIKWDLGGCEHTAAHTPAVSAEELTRGMADHTCTHLTSDPKQCPKLLNYCSNLQHASGRRQEQRALQTPLAASL